MCGTDVRRWVRATLLPLLNTRKVIGSRDISGDIIEDVGLDIRPGRNVDIIADATTFQPTFPVHVVTCVDTLEHTPSAKEYNATPPLGVGSCALASTVLTLPCQWMSIFQERSVWTSGQMVRAVGKKSYAISAEVTPAGQLHPLVLPLAHYP